MLAHAIGLQVFVRAAKMRTGVAGLTGTRHAANGIDDYGAALGNPVGAHGRRGSEARCGGIAAGAGDQHGPASGMAGSSGLQVLAEQLGQAESTRLEQLGTRVGVRVGPAAYKHQRQNNRTLMKRFLKYWTIRLLGREFVALPKTCKLVGLWWCLALVLVCGWADTNPLWSHLLTVGNFVASCVALRKIECVK